MSTQPCADLSLVPAEPFDNADKAALYRAIHERRDMRHFAGGSVPAAVLQRLLDAAHLQDSRHDVDHVVKLRSGR